MADKAFRPALLDNLASLGPGERRAVATTLQGLSATFSEVPDGKTAAYVLGVLAHLLDRAEVPDVPK